MKSRSLGAGSLPGQARTRRCGGAVERERSPCALCTVCGLAFVGRPRGCFRLRRQARNLALGYVEDCFNLGQGERVGHRLLHRGVLDTSGRIDFDRAVTPCKPEHAAQRDQVVV